MDNEIVRAGQGIGGMKHRRYNPAPSLTDISRTAWWATIELRYDVIPTRLWNPEVQQREYALWKADREATIAAVAGGERVMDELEKV